MLDLNPVIPDSFILPKGTENDDFLQISLQYCVETSACIIQVPFS